MNTHAKILPFTSRCGEVREWTNRHAWKACVPATGPWVRIPPSPPYLLKQMMARSRHVETHMADPPYRAPYTPSVPFRCTVTSADGEISDVWTALKGLGQELGAGPCAIEPCEPRQVRKEATVSSQFCVPQDHLAPLQKQYCMTGPMPSPESWVLLGRNIGSISTVGLPSFRP